MECLDGSCVHEAGGGDCASRKKKRHRRRRKSSAPTIAHACELQEAFTDEADTVCEDSLQKKPISCGLECAHESRTQKKEKQHREKCEHATKGNCAYGKSGKFSEKHCSSLNRYTHIRWKKHRNVKKLIDSESDDNEIKDAPCVLQCKQARTDVEEEDQTNAELEECDKIDYIAVVRKKQKKNKRNAKKHYSNLNHHTKISGDTVEAAHRHKKMKNLGDSGSDGNENEAVPCVMQFKKTHTDGEKEDQAIAELEECNKIDYIAVERKKRKKNKPPDAECTSCRDEIDTLLSDENLDSSCGRLHKKKKYKASLEGYAQATNISAVSDLRENCRDKCSTFNGKSDRILSDAGGNQNCTSRTPHKKKRHEVAKEHFQHGTSCSLSDQQMDELENNETCGTTDDDESCCSTRAVRKKRTRKLKLAVECADGLSGCALSSPTDEPSDSASFIDAAGESAQMGNELKKQSEMVLETSLHELGESPLKCNDGDCITQEHSNTQEALGDALKKKKRKLARLSTFGDELFHTVSLQADADSSETARKGSNGDKMTAPENYDTVPGADLGPASKNLKLHSQDTPGTSHEILSSAELSQERFEHASRSLKAALHKRQRSNSPPDPDFLTYVNGQQRYPSIHHKTKPPLETIRRYEEETGLTVDTGKYTAEEDLILLKNIHEIAKYYNIAYPHLIVGHCGEQDPAVQKEVKDLVRKEQLIRLLGRGLPRRTIHSAYMRARLLLDPLSTPKRLVLNLEQKERLQQMYNQLGPKWTVMAQKMGLPAEQLRSAFRYFKEKETFATGKWKKSEDELLRRAVEHQTRRSTAKRKAINWQAVSQYVRSRNASQCRRHWTFAQLTPLAGEETRKWDKFDSIHLIYIMHKLNASRSAEVDWEAVKNSFPWAQSPLVAKYHWESTLNYYLPPEQRDSFTSKVKNLYETALPSLLEKYGEGRTLEEIIKLSKSATA